MTLCDEYRFADAFGLLYSFTWSEVFDWYLEMSKPLLRDPETAAETRTTLGVVLRDVDQTVSSGHPVPDRGAVVAAGR